MADAAIVADKQDLKANWTTVQEMKVTGNELPERYINSTRKQASDEEIPYMVDAPYINLGLLNSSSSEAQAQVLEKLRSVLTTWGCFQLVNHGITCSLFDQICDDVKQASVPTSDVSMDSYRFEGFGSDDYTLNSAKRLYLAVYPQNRRKLDYWPKHPSSFSENLNEFVIKTGSIAEVLLKAMALSLNLEEDSFLKQYRGAGNEIICARFNYYPPCPEPDVVLGIRPHTDGSVVTILLQDKQVQGLQVCKDDKWYRVAIVPYALFVNIGDQMEVMSNGIFKSAYHKVTANPQKQRISVAMFCSPDPESEIAAPNALISKERPRLFKKYKNYEQNYFGKVDPINERGIDLLNI